MLQGTTIGSRAFCHPLRQSFSAKTERLNSNGSAVCHHTNSLAGHNSKRRKPLTSQSDTCDNALVFTMQLAPLSVQARNS
jgi:hypothetical protein